MSRIWTETGPRTSGELNAIIASRFKPPEMGAERFFLPLDDYMKLVVAIFHFREDGTFAIDFASALVEAAKRLLS